LSSSHLVRVFQRLLQPTFYQWQSHGSEVDWLFWTAPIVNL